MKSIWSILSHWMIWHEMWIVSHFIPHFHRCFNVNLLHKLHLYRPPKNEHVTLAFGVFFCWFLLVIAGVTMYLLIFQALRQTYIHTIANAITSVVKSLMDFNVSYVTESVQCMVHTFYAPFGERWTRVKVIKANNQIQHSNQSYFVNHLVMQTIYYLNTSSLCPKFILEIVLFWTSSFAFRLNIWTLNTFTHLVHLPNTMQTVLWHPTL